MLPRVNALNVFQTKSYREYIAERKNVDLLTEEDKFLLQLSRVERLPTKLAIMSYIGNFFDNIHLITPVRILLRGWQVGQRCKFQGKFRKYQQLQKYL